MIHLLFTVIFSEMFIILTLLFKTPLRKLVILTLDRIKRDKGPIVVKTVAGTVSAVFVSNVYSMFKIEERVDEAGAVNPTDQVLMATHLLEASLMGFLLFLALMIDRLHHYIRELWLLRKNMEAVKKQSRSFEDSKNGGNPSDVKSMDEQIAHLKSKIKTLESECESKIQEAKSAESNTEALKKQSTEFKSENNRLLEDNHNLRNQLKSVE